MMSYRLRVGPRSDMTGVLRREKFGHRDADT